MIAARQVPSEIQVAQDSLFSREELESILEGLNWNLAPGTFAYSRPARGLFQDLTLEELEALVRFLLS